MWRMGLFLIRAARRNPVLACSLIQIMPELLCTLTSSPPGEREEN